MTAVERLLATARAEIGYLEKETNKDLDDPTANVGDNNWTKYARDLDALGVYNGRKNGYAWCDMYVDWVFIKTFGLELGMQLTCQPMGGYGAGCTSSAQYYKNKGQFYKSSPKPGDQIFFTDDGGKTMAHTGIVEKVEGGRVYTIEGNTSSLPGVVPNGGAVRDKSYSLSYARIGGYGRPDYSIIKEEEEMDQEKFNEMFQKAMAEYRGKLQDNDSGEWSEKARQYAIEQGIFSGAGPGPDGQPNYMWQDFLTREQAAMLLYRFAEIHGLA